MGRSLETAEIEMLMNRGTGERNGHSPIELELLRCRQVTSGAKFTNPVPNFGVGTIGSHALSIYPYDSYENCIAGRVQQYVAQ